MTTFDDAADAELLRELTQPRPIAEYHEDGGAVLWWCWRDGQWLGEPPYVGTPNDLGLTIGVILTGTRENDGSATGKSYQVGGWPGYHTHFTPLPPMPEAPK